MCHSHLPIKCGSDLQQKKQIISVSYMAILSSWLTPPNGSCHGWVPPTESERAGRDSASPSAPWWRCRRPRRHVPSEDSGHKGSGDLKEKHGKMGRNHPSCIYLTYSPCKLWLSEQLLRVQWVQCFDMFWISFLSAQPCSMPSLFACTARLEQPGMGWLCLVGSSLVSKTVVFSSIPTWSLGHSCGREDWTVS